MKRTKIIDALQSTDYGSTVTVMGWVRTKRGSKSVNFIALNDGSTIKNIQIVADVEKFDEEILKKITTGACLSCEGTLVKSIGTQTHVGMLTHIFKRLTLFLHREICITSPKHFYLCCLEFCILT